MAGRKQRVGSGPATDVAAVVADLREQLSALEAQAVEIASSLNREIARASEAEERAMTAVREGDDMGARAALTENQDAVDAAGILQAELTLLKDMAVTCREAVERWTEDH